MRYTDQVRAVAQYVAMAGLWVKEAAQDRPTSRPLPFSAAHPQPE
jgi:hypothetical protein